MNVSLLQSAAHMPGCAGDCSVTRHVHNGRGWIERPVRQIPVTKMTRPRVAYVRTCTLPISSEPEIWIERLDWLDSDGLHIGTPEIVANDIPEGSADAVRKFAGVLETAAAALDAITNAPCGQDAAHQPNWLTPSNDTCGATR